MTITVLPVRKAGPSDRKAILDLCVLNHNENGQFSLSMPKVEGMIDRAFNRGGAIIGITGAPNRIEGMILLNISQWWYTDDWCLEEVMNFIHPDFRRSTHAKEMIRFAKRCAEELSIPLVIGVVSNDRTQAKIDLYSRQLGTPAGAYFIHRPVSYRVEKQR